MREGEVPLCVVREMLVVIETVHSHVLEAESVENTHMSHILVQQQLIHTL